MKFQFRNQTDSISSESDTNEALFELEKDVLTNEYDPTTWVFSKRICNNIGGIVKFFSPSEIFSKNVLFYFIIVASQELQFLKDF